MTNVTFESGSCGVGGGPLLDHAHTDCPTIVPTTMLQQKVVHANDQKAIQKGISCRTGATWGPVFCADVVRCSVRTDNGRF